MVTRRKAMKILGAGALLAAGTAAAGYGVMKTAPFGAMPSGNRLERIQSSPNFKEGQFVNLDPASDFTSKRSRVEVMGDFFFGDKAQRTPPYPVPSKFTDLSRLKENDLVWFGHSGVIFKKAGLTIAADPSLHDAFPFEVAYAPFPGSAIYQPEHLPPLDYLLITHDHYDHLDYRTFVPIQSRVKKVICPLGVGAHLESWGCPPSKIVELDWFESFPLSSASELTLVPSRHFSGRTFKRNQTLWGGFVLDLNGYVFYLSGDTSSGSHFQMIKDRFPKIDFAVLEDGQYNVDWADVHLLPSEWKKAAQTLSPNAIMTCHNSKYSISVHSWNEPMITAYQSAKELGIPMVNPLIGQRIDLENPDTNLPQWWI